MEDATFDDEDAKAERDGYIDDIVKELKAHQSKIEGTTVIMDHD